MLLHYSHIICLEWPANTFNDVQKLSVAYETLVHQYAEVVEERQQLFNAFVDTKNEMAMIKARR